MSTLFDMGQSNVDILGGFVFGTIVALQAVFVLGLRLLAQKMVDLYGLSLDDLSVILYIYVGIKNSNIILTSKPPTN